MDKRKQLRITRCFKPFKKRVCSKSLRKVNEFIKANFSQVQDDALICSSCYLFATTTHKSTQLVEQSPTVFKPPEDQQTPLSGGTVKTNSSCDSGGNDDLAKSVAFEQINKVSITFF